MNFTEKNITSNELTLEDIKKRLTEKLFHESALDIKDFKLYHQINLHQRHNFYVSPVATDLELSDYKNSDEESNTNNLKKNINESNALDDSNENKLGKKLSSQINKTINLPNLRIISPYNKHFSCNCKKSQCVKNYCICRINKEVCDETCQCISCRNLTFFSQ